MKKQTAVDFFYWELIQRLDFTPMGGWDVINNILDQAKAIEKEQIMDAFINGSCDCQKLLMDSDVKQYYNETYNK